ncbi:hypothetical protein JHFBIEKO_3553 [Methylobacterium mesophilicum]|nr:hypothetical protein JHFBIEKO_3553 [Methylobacterium mesophilicum]
MRNSETQSHVEIYDMTLDLSMGSYMYSGHEAAAMAFFNDLVRVIAEVEGMDPMTVRGIGLSVREGGHISKGGRGLSAAKMTVRDSANMLIGVNGCTHASKASATVETFRLLNPSNIIPSRSKFKGVLKDILLSQKGFGSSLEGLISLCTPTLGNIDLLGETITRGFAFDKFTKDKIATSESIDSFLRLEIRFIKTNNAVTVELQEISSEKSIFKIIYGSIVTEESVDRYDLTAISLKTIRTVGSAIYS